ncbi:hypothetical protein CHGG_05346 [Chaetomium globosum CBS 148.51]|uniref:Putative gamma-glutamylcyclotransferase n=1 Tax=Chaetomium globosum (strain ATCC 6205 / CBS 148.51 / DSM 1962 / NBRC 6347 / NRRL 1970) TaxID=306901 RepID=Q2H7L9_CHAGB|nr:uncharacterized protein CHGG_05346 [Chaetomium globosum CBS 148.51]EAQ88727.1 hypothetical protein CHGG_05346 [Chaetomium globosum CBS 148.51]
MEPVFNSAEGPPSPPDSPPPPPSTSVLAGAQAPAPDTRPSPYLEKLASMPDNYVFWIPPRPPYVYEPIYYFFYGTLTSPHILKEVLGLKADPVLRSAKIVGYGLTNWGQYKALIDKPGAVVTGYAYKVQSVDDELKLAYYETNAYELAPCEISFTDDPEKEEDRGPVIGHTFKYAGDAQASRQKGRGFNLTLWEMYMGTRLPPGWQMKAEPEVDQKATGKPEEG